MVQGPDLEVCLALKFRDPEGEDHALPEGLRLTVQPAIGEAEQFDLGAEGILHFRVAREAEAFRLRFEFTDPTYVGFRSALEETRLLARGDLNDAIRDGTRVFLLPLSWEMGEADWDSTWTAGFNGREFSDLAGLADLGRPGAAQALVLLPRWQFLQFEFFDRYYGRFRRPNGHGRQRVTVPPFLLRGFRRAPADPGIPPDTESNWTVPAPGQSGDPPVSRRVQCLPWILQRTLNRGTGRRRRGALDAMPDRGTVLEFRWAERSCVVSERVDGRRIDQVDADRLRQGGAGRLRYYDLPRVWRSTGQFARITRRRGRLYERLTRRQLLRSLERARPLTFCLDDLMLAVGDPANPEAELVPAPDLSAERAAVFLHSFDRGPFALVRCSAIGLWKPDSRGSYVSAVDRAHEGRYFFDYPDWTRLIVVDGDLWEAFDRRIPDGPGHVAVGARAAVRWVKGMAPVSGVVAPADPPDAAAAASPTVPAAGTVLQDWLDDVRVPFFAMQPFYDQEYQASHDVDPTVLQWVGRSDLALLRCCDRDEHEGRQVERGCCFAYVRLAVSFDPGPPNYPPHPPPGWPHTKPWPPREIQLSDLFRADGAETPEVRQSRTDYINSAMRDIPRWWADDDGGPRTPEPPVLAATDTGPPLTHRFVLFTQSVAGPTRAHFAITVRPHRVAAALPGRERPWMASYTGHGTWYDTDNVATPGFALAHELGHGWGLPDEYIELENASLYQPSVRYYLPGDPFSPDAGSLMVDSLAVRNRHAWPAAEFARRITGRPHAVAVGRYRNYRLPPYPDTDHRTLAFWPVAQRTNATLGSRGRFDTFAYLAGADRFIADRLGDDGEGIVIVVVKLRCTFFGFADTNVMRDLLAGLTTRLDALLTGTYILTAGRLRTGSVIPWTVTPGRKWEVRFSTRFEVTNAGDPLPADTWHVAMTVTQRAGINLTPVWHQPVRAGDRWKLSTFADPDHAAEWARAVAEEYGEMLGVGRLVGPQGPQDAVVIGGPPPLPIPEVERIAGILFDQPRVERSF